jgi:hypothetical protein
MPKSRVSLTRCARSSNDRHATTRRRSGRRGAACGDARAKARALDIFSSAVGLLVLCRSCVRSLLRSSSTVRAKCSSGKNASAAADGRSVSSSSVRWLSPPATRHGDHRPRRHPCHTRRRFPQKIQARRTSSAALSYVEAPGWQGLLHLAACPRRARPHGSLARPTGRDAPHGPAGSRSARRDWPPCADSRAGCAMRNALPQRRPSHRNGANRKHFALILDEAEFHPGASGKMRSGF